MRRRFRWTRPLPQGATATVTRIAGDHELPANGPERRYALDCSRAASVAVDGTPTVEPAGDNRFAVTVPADAGLARVRVAVSGERARLRLPGPTVAEQCTEAIRGDGDAARALLDRDASAVSLAFAAGEFLGVRALLDLLDTVADASAQAADELHARRYALVRGFATTPAGPAADSREAFETLVDGLDGTDAVGGVDALDALADAMHVAYDDPAAAREFLTDLGYGVRELEEQGDGRFGAHVLAHVAANGSVADAKHHAAAREPTASFDDAKERAEHADYGDRGAAWRDVVAPAAERSFPEFAYVLANALYWTGETGRGDSRADELLFEGAAAAASAIDLKWITGHARFERARAVGHRHRTSRNHALALAAFEEARDVADRYDFLDPWEPTYTYAVVESNRLSTRGEHDAAVAALEDVKAELTDQGVPEGRREEMFAHLDAQRHERRAIQTADGESQRSHLEAALEQYENADLERAVERVREKLVDGEGEDVSGGVGGAGGQVAGAVWRRALPAGRERGPSLGDVPALHDFLTESDPRAVGSADPGVLPDERDDSVGGDSDPRYR